MKRSDLRGQTQECLTSDIMEESKIVWMYLAVVVPQGCGAEGLGKRLSIRAERVRLALEVLEERKAVRRHQRGFGEVWVAEQWPIEESAPTGRGHGLTHDGQRKARLILVAYKKRRSAEGLGYIHAEQASLKAFGKLGETLDELGVDFDKWLDFAIERTAFMRDKMPFPTPAILAGDWLKSVWMDEAMGSSKRPKEPPAHAGASYRDPTLTREELVKAGIEEARSMSKEQLRHAEKLAFDLVRFPELVGTPPEKYRRVVEYIIERGNNATSS